MLSMGAGEGFFLGISDIDDEGYWVTLLDNEVYTGPFGEGQPSSTHPLYDCGGIVSLPELAGNVTIQMCFNHISYFFRPVDIHVYLGLCQNLCVIVKYHRWIILYLQVN